MSKYEIEVNTQNWYCDCCGSGTHFDITLYENGDRIWGTSRNDQFGGVYREGDDENINLYSGYEPIVMGMEVALKALGHSVKVDINLDEEDPYYDDNYDED